MLRSIELGRAILCLPATNLELWLTTLITVSLQQDDINTQQLTSAQIVNLLSSGKVWVYRGPGMYVELHVTVRDEPFSYTQLQDLIKSLLRAPIWEQLMLHPSPSTDEDLKPGTIRLNINHATCSGIKPEQQYHRIFLNVPPADVRPPEGIPRIAFCSVRFSLQFLDTRLRQRTTRKRTKTTFDDREVLQTCLVSPGSYDSEDSDDLLHEVNYCGVDDPLKSFHPSLTPRPVGRKRRLSKSKMMSSSPAELSNHTGSPNRASKSTSDLQPPKPPIAPLPDENVIVSLIDGAIRLSIYGNYVGKSANGIKVKANTFHLGLANIAPSLWRPGYLPALSQRAHLLGTVNRSIHQAACVKATSMSLAHKVQRLKMHSTSRLGLPFPNLVSVAEPKAIHMTSSIACQLWRHLQQSLLNQPTISLHPLTADVSQPEVHTGPDEMLAETMRTEEHFQPSTLNREKEDSAQLHDMPNLGEPFV